MAEKNDKNSSSGKTLMLKPTLLGIKKPSETSSNNAAPQSNQTLGHSKNTLRTSGVVVVKKTRVGMRREDQSSESLSSSSSSSSSKEQDRKLQLIRQADSERKLEQQKKMLQENKRRELEELREKERLRREQAENARIEEEKLLSAKEKIETIKLQSEDIKNMILTKGRVRNLNSIAKPKVEEKDETIAPDPTNKTSSTATNPSGVKENVSHSKDKVAISGGIKKKSKGLEEDLEKAAAIAKAKGIEESKYAKKLSIAQVLTMDQDEENFRRTRSLASIRRAKEKARRKAEGGNIEREKILREVLLPDFITVQELASRMSEKSSEVIKSLMKLGMVVTLNQSVDADTAELVVNEFGHRVKRITVDDIERGLLNELEDTATSLILRPPVVTVMGHVDHGKTSLLDALRSTDIVGGEAGGITQHIGAYKVTLENGKQITFLDTPGHEAFTAMRLRGAKVTDIVILVVAADDGIMQQTIEAISHAKAANVPIIVAINKIDKPDADPTRVKNELLSHDLVAEDMGGDIIVVEVSAKQRLNLDKLEESILMQAEMLNLRANPNRLAKGIVIEAKVDKGRGVVATVLVQKGTLKTGDMIVAGKSFGKIRALVNDKGVRVHEAEPSVPVEVLGLNDAPEAGDEFLVTVNEKTARDICDFRMNREKEKALVNSRKASLEQMFLKAKNTNFKDFHVIIKADVQGSAEAISSTLLKLANEEIQVKILHSGVGGITESDITLATASDAFIVGFNVRANNQARDLAKKNGVEIRYYSIIYNLVDDVKAAMGGMLSPSIKEEFTGYADVKQVFNLTKFGVVAGCYVTEGIIKRSSSARLIRDNFVIYNGKLKALKRFKDDVKEVKHGFECGISFENYDDIKPGDKIEAYEVITEQRTL